MTSTYLSFKICNELYAVNVANVLEVLEKQDITQVPNVPSFILGIINFRGNVVPVFDSRLKFNLSEQDPDASYVIVVFDLSKNEQNLFIGAMVDKVTDVISINDSDIQPVPPMSKDFNTDFLDGIVKLDNQFIMIVNIGNFFTNSEVESLSHEDILALKE